MGKKKRDRQELLPGTLDMLILKALSRSVMHGYGIAEHIRQMSEEVLHVEEGPLPLARVPVAVTRPSG